MDKRDIAVLAGTRLFSGIDPRELAAFLAPHDCPVRSFAPGSVVLLAGCRYEDLRVILEGEAAAELASAEGRSMIVETLRAPDIVAGAVLFSPERRLPVTLVARSELRLATIPRPVLLGLCARFEPVLVALLEDMGNRVAFLAARLRATSFATIRERLADWLLSRARREDGVLLVRLDITKELLAATFGVPRPSLSREFGELERRGLIASEGKTLRILDEDGLRSLFRRQGA
jgi:CRP-like cAMP-binding protein